MWESSPKLVADASNFTEMLGAIWGFATLTSRSRAKLPVLAPSQARALQIVIASGGIIPADLAREMNLSRPQVSEVVRKLEENGLTQRQRSKADGRSVQITATERGVFVQKHFRLGLVDAVAEAFSAMPEEEVARIMEAMPVLAALHDQLSAIAAREERGPAAG